MIIIEINGKNVQRGFLNVMNTPVRNAEQKEILSNYKFIIYAIFKAGKLGSMMMLIWLLSVKDVTQNATGK